VKRACRFLLHLPLQADVGDDTGSWRRMRRATHEALNKGHITEYRPLQEKEAVILIDGMLRNPVGWESELHR